MSRKARQKREERKQKLILLIFLLVIVITIFVVKYYRDALGEIGFDPNDIPYYDMIRFEDGPSGKILSEDKQLNIFNSPAHDGAKIIFPGAHGEYDFFVYNITTGAIGVDLHFSDENPNRVPMRYKVKIDGAYHIGSDARWYTMPEIVKLPALFCTLAPGSNLRVTVIWEWQDVDDIRDTQLGIAAADGRAEYLLSIKAVAESYSS